MARRWSVVATAAVSVLVSCQFEDKLAGRSVNSAVLPISEGGLAALLDGRDPKGTIGFYWLPPVRTAAKSYPGTFDPQLAPTVEICAAADDLCTARIGRLTMAGTPDGSILVESGDAAYRATWLVPPTHQDPGKIFRFRVLLDGRLIGYADLPGLAPGPNASSRSIRFRLESSLRTTQNIGPGGGSLTTPNGAVTLSFPAGALTQPTNVTITATPHAPTSNFVGAWDFGPSGSTFAAPVTATLPVDPALLANAGAGAYPALVTQAKPTDTTWTLVPGSAYDANLGKVSAPLTHFSTYALIILAPIDFTCARLMGPQVSATFPPTHCHQNIYPAYNDTVYVTQGGTAQTALGSYVSRLYGPLPVIGFVVSCENVLTFVSFCAPVLQSASADPTIAVRNSTGLVTGLKVGTTVMYAHASNFTKGATLVIVSPGATTTQLFSFAFGASANVGTALGSPSGGPSFAGGRLTLNGSNWIDINQRIVSGGSLSIAFFAREATPNAAYAEFMSQGTSGSGFYIGHAPNGHIRVSDTWLDTGIPMPQDNLEHHYAVTYDDAAAVMRLYIDGQLRTTLPGQIARGLVGGNNTRFGRQFDPFGEYLNGDIDDLGVYGSVLSPTEVQTLARRSADLSCSAKGTLFSGSGPATWMVFENQTGEGVRVEWLDFAGNPVLYAANLPNGTAYSQGTYITHPWMVTGLSSGKCYGIWLPITGGRIVRIQ